MEGKEAATLRAHPHLPLQLHVVGDVHTLEQTWTISSTRRGLSLLQNFPVPSMQHFKATSLTLQVQPAPLPLVVTGGGTLSELLKPLLVGLSMPMPNVGTDSSVFLLRGFTVLLVGVSLSLSGLLGGLSLFKLKVSLHTGMRCKLFGT